MRDGGHVETDLAAIDAAPGEGFAGGGEGDRVVIAAFDVDDSIVLKAEAFYDLGCVDDGVVVTGSFFDTAAAETIHSPGPDTLLFVDSEGVVCTGMDGFISSEPRAKRLRLE